MSDLDLKGLKFLSARELAAKSFFFFYPNLVCILSSSLSGFVEVEVSIRPLLYSQSKPSWFFLCIVEFDF